MGFLTKIAQPVSPRLPCLSPQVKMLTFGHSLTLVSLHAHIYKNTRVIGSIAVDELQIVSHNLFIYAM
jgi:hypothetical protein